MQRLAGPKFEIQAFEQQPAASDQCQPLAIQQAGSRLILQRMHILIAQAEMMADLVDQDVADQMLERLALLAPFGKDGLAEQADPIGQCSAGLDAALADRNALIDAGQVKRMVDPHFPEQLVVGKFVDLQDDMGEMRRKWIGQCHDRIARDGLNFLGRRGVVEASRHGLLA